MTKQESWLLADQQLVTMFKYWLLTFFKKEKCFSRQCFSIQNFTYKTLETIFAWLKLLFFHLPPISSLTFMFFASIIQSYGDLWGNTGFLQWVQKVTSVDWLYKCWFFFWFCFMVMILWMMINFLRMYCYFPVIRFVKVALVIVIVDKLRYNYCIYYFAIIITKLQVGSHVILHPLQVGCQKS